MRTLRHGGVPALLLGFSAALVLFGLTQTGYPRALPLARSRIAVTAGQRRRAPGSWEATCRATESTPGRAYRSSERTEECRDRASSIWVLVPFSASWVSALCRQL